MRSPRRPGEAGLDRLGSVTLSQFLVPDLDLWVPGHRRWTPYMDNIVSQQPTEYLQRYVISYYLSAIFPLMWSIIERARMLRHISAMDGFLI